MTVTITALCDASHKRNTANMVMCADTLITYSSEGVPISSNPNGSKIYELPCGFYVAIADSISTSHQVVSYLYKEMEPLSRSDPKLTDKIKLALERTAEYVRLWMRREVLALYQISEDEFLHDKKLKERAQIAADIKKAAISTQLTIAGFKENGTPVLFFTDCINIREQTSPGFFCGGAGSSAATHWLNYRKQNSFMSAQRTFFHVREAKQFAEICPVVGSLTNMIFISPGKLIVEVSEVHPTIESWWASLHIKPTDSLDADAARKDFFSAYKIDLI